MSVPRIEYSAVQAKPFKFRPPRTSRWWVRFVGWLLPLFERLDGTMVPVEFDPADLDRLRALRGHRVVLTPNHPEGVEPYVLFRLARIFGDEFNYIAAKEAFEQPPPPFRWVKWLGLYAPIMQRLGVYSIVRGTADRESFRTTRGLLVKGERWLVIFPEGEVCWHSENLMPLQEGVAQFGFWALEDLCRAGEPPPLYFMPVAIKFRFVADVRSGIDRTLRQLEHKLRLPPPDPSATRYDRLRRVGEAVLTINEKRYGTRPPANASFDDRMQAVKELILARISATVGVAQNPAQPLLERVRELFNALDRIVHDEYGEDAYEQRVRNLSPQEIQTLYAELSRMLHIAAFHDGYVKETMSAERFYDVLGQLEWEVFRRRSSWGLRKAAVKFGTPINLTDHLADYRSDKRRARAVVTGLIDASLHKMLDDLAEGAQAIQG
jgi:hypothetical protein